MGFNSDAKSSESIATKQICIFVANDDLTCSKIVEEMLQFCTYEELYFEEAWDALNAILERKDTLGHILTNVHRFNVEAFKILQNFEKQYNLRTIVFNPPDDPNIELESQGRSVFTAYIVKCSSVDNLYNLWESALAIVNAKRQENKQEESGQKGPSFSTKSSPISFDEAINQVNFKRKTRSDDEDNEDGHKRKKPRMVWTQEMHQKFVRAIEILGYEKAVPNKIVQVMNIPGLKRENVASHLQKYRMSLKRVQESSFGSSHEMNLKSDVNEPFFSHFTQHFYGTQMHQMCTPNISSFSSAMPPKKSHIDVGSFQCIDQNGFMQYQSRFAPKIMLNNNFRVYNDKTKNVLMNITNSSSSSLNRTDSGSNFHGLRFTSDGMGIEFGQPGSSSNTIKIGRSEVQQHSLPLLENYSIEDLVQLPPLPENYEVQQESPSTKPLCIADNHQLVPVYPASGDEHKTTLLLSPDVQSIQYPSPNGICDSHKVHQMATFGTIFGPPEDNSVENSVTHIQQLLEQESPQPPPLPTEPNEGNSFGKNGELDVLLNATGSPRNIPDQLFWDTEIGDILYEINHT